MGPKGRARRPGIVEIHAPASSFMWIPRPRRGGDRSASILACDSSVGPRFLVGIFSHRALPGRLGIHCLFLFLESMALLEAEGAAFILRTGGTLYAPFITVNFAARSGMIGFHIREVCV